MANEATTIYIDDSAICALVVRGRKIQKWANMPLEPGLVKNGVILNSVAVADKVRELWRAQSIGATRVIAGISGINCLYRLMTIPEVPRDSLPEAIRREADRVLGVPLEQFHLSWQTLSSSKGEILIYLAASPRNTVNALVTTLRRAGLNPYLMDLKPLALAMTSTEPRAIMIDVQASSFDIVIMVEGIPQIVRSLPLAKEAVLQEKLPIIREELDRAITFYNSSHMDKPLEDTVPLLVCGELIEQEDAWRLLIGRQERPVKALPAPVESSENFPTGQYITNIGLALKELSGGKGAGVSSVVNLNALPDVFRPKPRPLSEILFVPAIITGLVIIAVGAFFTINTMTYTASLRQDVKVLNQKIASKLAQSQKTGADIEKEIAALRKKVSSQEAKASAYTTTLGSFAPRRDEINGDLGQVYKFPAALNPPAVNHNTTTVSVTGSADNEDAVFRYAEDLRASGRFSLVVVSRINDTGDFALTLFK